MFDGLKLLGFAVWERRSGGGRNVTFPARQHSVNGERHSFALLRPIADSAAQERVRDLELQAYVEYERTATESLTCAGERFQSRIPMIGVGIPRPQTCLLKAMDGGTAPDNIAMLSDWRLSAVRRRLSFSTPVTPGALPVTCDRRTGIA